MIALILIILIMTGIYPGCRGRKGDAYSAADGRRLHVTGTVESRECSINGYRVVIDHLRFEEGGADSSKLYKSLSRKLNDALDPADRIQVFLSNGQAENITMYGEGDEASFWSHSSAAKDQTDQFTSIRTGDRVWFFGKCNQPEKPTNPGQFDSRGYYLARRIILKMSEAELENRERPERTSLFSPVLLYRNLLADFRISMQMGLADVFMEHDASIAAAYILGDKSGLNAETQQLFRDGGLSWLICVSSMHISLLGMLVYRFLRKKGRTFVLSAAVSFTAVGSYAVITGFSVSAQRALITFLLWLGAQVFGRTPDTLTSLSCAAIYILSRQPYALWDSTFLISVVCILSLEFFTPALERILKPRYSLQKKICGSISIWLGSLPVVLWFFYQTAPFASFLFLIAMPVMSLLFGFGIIASLAGCGALVTGAGVFLYIGRTFAWPCHILLKVMQMICVLERMVPGSVLILGRPAVWQMILYYAALIFFTVCVRNMNRDYFRHSTVPHTRCSRRKIFCQKGIGRTRLVSGGLLTFMIFILCVRIDPGFHFLCLDIGQGSCNLIRYNGHVFLFDAGSSSVENIWQYRIDSTLKYYGISKIDAVFLSHGDMDHINGIEQMLDLYHRNLTGHNAGDATIGMICLPDLPCVDDRLAPIIDGAAENSIPLEYVAEGQSFRLGEMTFEILSPSSSRITGNANEDCIVMMVSVGNLQILLTGDLEKEGETMFLKAEKEKISRSRRNIYRLLIAGHHGSRNATSEDLLDLYQPDTAIISCGKNNRYGHPANEVLDRFRAFGIPYKRTDLEGAIGITY